MLCRARLPDSCTQPPLFLLLDRLLLFLPPNSDPCLQSHLASHLFRPPPWLQRKGRGKSLWLHLARRRRWRLLSAAQLYSTWNAWLSSARLWPPPSTSVGGRRLGLRITSPPTG